MIARGDRPSPSDHERLSALLPWWVNGTLEGAEARDVAAHLPTCASCRLEEARLQRLAVAVRTAHDVELLPHRPLARLLDRLDAEEEAGAAIGEPPPRGRWSGARSAMRRLAAGVTAWPAGARWALAAQLAVIVVLAGWLASSVPAPTRYHTLSRGAQATAGPVLRVVFADQATEGEIRALLHRSGGRIIDGPSPMGVYTISLGQLPAPALRTAVAELRADPRVRFAELRVVPESGAEP